MINTVKYIIFYIIALLLLFNCGNYQPENTNNSLDINKNNYFVDSDSNEKVSLQKVISIYNKNYVLEGHMNKPIFSKCIEEDSSVYKYHSIINVKSKFKPGEIAVIYTQNINNNERQTTEIALLVKDSLFKHNIVEFKVWDKISSIPLKYKKNDEIENYIFYRDIDKMIVVENIEGMINKYLIIWLCYDDAYDKLSYKEIIKYLKYS